MTTLTVNRELCLLSHAFNLAIKEWEWIDFNPVSRVSRERVNNQVERWLTFEEQEKLLAVSPLWLREIIIFAVNTGWRRSEIRLSIGTRLISSGKRLLSWNRRTRVRTHSHLMNKSWKF
jgi:hypothetical protein